MTEKHYAITLNETQLNALVKAVDFYSRIKCGQLSEITNIMRDVICHHEREIPLENIEAAERLLREVKMLLFPDLKFPEAHYGIRGAKSEVEKITYDIEQVIRHRLTWDAETGNRSMNVWSSEPFAASKQPLPKIEKVD